MGKPGSLRYEHLLDGMMQTWPVLLVIPVISIALIIPFWSMTKHELAPDEDWLTGRRDRFRTELDGGTP